MMTLPFSPASMFGSLGMTPALFVPVIVLLLFVVMVLPGLSRPGVKPESLARAAYGYLAQSIGIILMTTGGLPAVYAVIAQQALSSNMYLGLLLVFVIGGLTYLWHDNFVRSIDGASKAIPAALFFYSWKFIGLLVMLFAGLTYLLNALANAGHEPLDWWISPFVLFLYGFLLSWFTFRRPDLPVMKTPVAIPTMKSQAPAKKTVKPKSRPPLAKSSLGGLQ